MTRFDKLIEKLKDSKIVALLLLVGIGLIALGNAVDAMGRIKGLFSSSEPRISVAPVGTGQDDRDRSASLDLLRLEKDLRSLEYQLAKARQDPTFLSNFAKLRDIDKLARQRLKEISASPERLDGAERVEDVILALSLAIGHMKENGWDSKPETARSFRGLEDLLLEAELVKKQLGEKTPNPTPAADGHGRR